MYFIDVLPADIEKGEGFDVFPNYRFESTLLSPV